MRFILHPDVKAGAPRALAWVRDFFGRFDTSLVGWLRIDFGREYLDRCGRRYHRFRGVYGRCWYPTEQQPTVRLSCQVPGPFPCEIVTRQKPVYRNPDGTWPPEARRLRGPVFEDARTGRQWKRVYGRTLVNSLDEGIVWIVAHEAYHWLRKTGQVPGRNNEVEADAFADRMLREFRENPSWLSDLFASSESERLGPRSTRRSSQKPGMRALVPPAPSRRRLTKRGMAGGAAVGPDIRAGSQGELFARL